MTQEDLEYLYIADVAIAFVLVFFLIRYYIRLKFGSFQELITLLEKYFETKELANEAIRKAKRCPTMKQ